MNHYFSNLGNPFYFQKYLTISDMLVCYTIHVMKENWRILTRYLTHCLAPFCTFPSHKQLGDVLINLFHHHHKFHLGGLAVRSTAIRLIDQTEGYRNLQLIMSGFTLTE